jgi:uncharacterized protein
MTRIDQKLLDLLSCPVSKSPLTPLSSKQLDVLNAALGSGNIQNVDGQTLSGNVQAGLISTDGKVIYRIEDGIAVLLPEEGIGTTQFDNFPR